MEVLPARSSVLAVECGLDAWLLGEGLYLEGVDPVLGENHMINVEATPEDVAKMLGCGRPFRRAWPTTVAA